MSRALTFAKLHNNVLNLILILALYYECNSTPLDIIKI
jgi:hypothetical protein